VKIRVRKTEERKQGMSGHSKFANIKHKKEKNDAQKGKIFTIIGREIVIAVKAGGADPDNNSKLRDVIAKAKAANMPNDTIKRGIEKAAGAASADNYEHITYEGYGPAGVAVIVQTLTDNKNRTAADVRSAFSKGHGNIGTPGCVSFMFDEKGQILIDKEQFEDEVGGSADDLMMTALDAGAEDFNEYEDYFEVLTDPESFSEVRESLEKENIPMMEADIAMIPQTKTALTDETDIANMRKILDLLDESDDVQNVYTNLDGDLDD
jgi:YebC/PmpR family DNA-binding regulatory protein